VKTPVFSLTVESRSISLWRRACVAYSSTAARRSAVVHHERHAENRVRPGREEPDLLTRMAFHGKGQLRAFGAPDPVALHQLDRLGPVDALEVVEQAVGVGGDLEKPLLEILPGDRRIRVPPAAAVDHLFVGQDGAALLAPPLRAGGPKGESALEHQQEEPLGPAIVLGRGRVDFAGPVVGASDQFQLSLEVCRVTRHRLLGMQSLEQCIVFSRQAKGIPAHRVQDAEPGHPLVASDHVARNVVVQMADREAVARGIGKHLEHVKLWPFAVLARQVEVGAVPFGLPVGLDFPRLVAFIHRHSTSFSGGSTLARDPAASNQQCAALPRAWCKATGAWPSAVRQNDCSARYLLMRLLSRNG
jgi:hypothetical protein